jgi:hypothetical protein
MFCFYNILFSVLGSKGKLSKKCRYLKSKWNLFSKIYFVNREFECSPFWKNNILRLLYGSSQQQYLYIIYVSAPVHDFRLRKPQ